MQDKHTKRRRVQRRFIKSPSKKFQEKEREIAKIRERARMDAEQRLIQEAWTKHPKLKWSYQTHLDD